MGQVAIDLPDPLNSSTPTPAPGVDDLLAQLAGEEIDRLLAEADVERPAPPAVLVITPEGLQPPPTATAPPPAPISNASAVALAPSAVDPAQIAPEPSPAAPPPPPAAPLAQADVEELDARVAQELNSLFTELDSEKPAPPAAKPAPPPAANAPDSATETAVAAVLAAAAPTPSDPVAQAAELEKQMLSKTLMDALGSPAEVQNATSGKSINLSFLLKPLEWINAPLAACSDALREALGKVAIMTLFNALAILLYVLFLRKH